MNATRGRPIVVLLGGPSAEHDVSVVSGTAVADALADRGEIVEQVLIDLSGSWWWLPPDHRREGRSAAAYDEPEALGADGPFGPGAAMERLAAADPSPIVFIALHGPFGEDGTVQALLEAAGIVHTGCGVAASALGMDKALFKRLSRGLGMPVVDWQEVDAPRWAADPEAVLADLDAFAAGTGDERLMIKPARLGSSVGMTLAHTVGERAAGLDQAFRYDSVALAERYLPGARDLEVSVIGNDPRALHLFGPGEITSGHEFYDFSAKYDAGVSRTSLRAEVGPDQRSLILDLAADAYRAIGAEGFARVDFLLTPDRTYLNEINTGPGFTPISLFPSLPSEAGYGFGDVAAWIVELALERDSARVRRALRPEDLPR